MDASPLPRRGAAERQRCAALEAARARGRGQALDEASSNEALNEAKTDLGFAN